MMAIAPGSNTAALIRERLTMDQVVRRYGFEPNRSGFIPCPFHSGDHTASLKLYSGGKGWHCFGCGKGGSVIDFVMELHGINFRQAIVRINSDFNLGLIPGQRPTAAENSRYLEIRRKEKEALEQYRREYDNRCLLFRSYREAIEAGKETPLYYEALRNMAYLEYWFRVNPWR